jgi:hypothetical protein
VKTPNALACPFCRASLKLADGGLPIGQEVECSKCHGKFTAEAPPAGVFVSATSSDSCPFCRTALDIPANHPAGKRVKCPQCEMTFQPLRKPSSPPAPYQSVAAEVATAEAPVLRKAASKTRLGPSNSAPQLSEDLSARSTGASRMKLVKDAATRNSKTQLVPPAAMLESIADPELGPPKADREPAAEEAAPPSGVAACAVGQVQHAQRVERRAAPVRRQALQAEHQVSH